MPHHAPSGLVRGRIISCCPTYSTSHEAAWCGAYSPDGLLPAVAAPSVTHIGRLRRPFVFILTDNRDATIMAPG